MQKYHFHTRRLTTDADADKTTCTHRTTDPDAERDNLHTRLHLSFGQDDTAEPADDVDADRHRSHTELLTSVHKYHFHTRLHLSFGQDDTAEPADVDADTITLVQLSTPVCLEVCN